MADSSPKPGQTINPKSTEGEMAVKIDHGSATSPSTTAKVPEEAPQNAITDAPAQPAPTEQVAPAQSSPEVEEQNQMDARGEEVSEPTPPSSNQITVGAEQDLASDSTGQPEFEDTGTDDSFNFVNDAEEARIEPVTGEYTWTASEYIAHEKTAGWYVVLFLLAAILAGVTFYFTKDKVSIFIIFFAAFVFAYFASHKPREMNYMITPDGVTVGNKQYHFDDFKSFGLVPEGAFTSIIFMPHKRFAIPITIYYPPESETKIAELIGNYLPFEEHSKDAIDKLLRAVRF